MKANVGKMDRFARVVVSIPLVVYGLMEGSMLSLIVGLIILATGVFGFCGLYTLFKVDTCKKKDSEGNCKI